MIFYFTGTGNTRWAAQLLAEATDDELHYIPDELDNTKLHYELKDGDPHMVGNHHTSFVNSYVGRPSNTSATAMP